MKNFKETSGWWFCGDSLRNGEKIPPDGEWLVSDGDIKICQSGLHASLYPIDALVYAPGSTICRVACRNIVEEQKDKFVCKERKIEWRIDGENLLLAFVCQFALDMSNMWEMPNVVRKYLETGDESIREKAGNVAEEAFFNMNTTWSTAAGAAISAAKDPPFLAASKIARYASIFKRNEKYDKLLEDMIMLVRK